MPCVFVFYASGNKENLPRRDNEDEWKWEELSEWAALSNLHKGDISAESAANFPISFRINFQ